MLKILVHYGIIFYKFITLNWKKIILRKKLFINFYPIKDPEFISLIPLSDRLLVFYLDASPSDSSNVPYVASICRSKSEEFSSFLQARLSCKIGDFSFSNLNAIRETKSGIFASFTTSSVYFRKSVLCFYDFDSIKNQTFINTLRMYGG